MSTNSIGGNTPIQTTDNVSADLDTPIDPATGASEEFSSLMNAGGADTSGSSIDPDARAQAEQVSDLLHATMMKQVFSLGQQMAKDNQKAQEDWKD